jgi:hypothetical protein
MNHMNRPNWYSLCDCDLSCCSGCAILKAKKFPMATAMMRYHHVYHDIHDHLIIMFINSNIWYECYEIWDMMIMMIMISILTTISMIINGLSYVKMMRSKKTMGCLKQLNRNHWTCKQRTNQRSICLMIIGVKTCCFFLSGAFLKWYPLVN